MVSKLDETIVNHEISNGENLRVDVLSYVLRA